MTNQETEALLRECVIKFGPKDQIIMLAEETGELMQAMSKLVRGRIAPMELAAEMADVLIVLAQISHIVSEMTAGAVTPDNFQQWVEHYHKQKLERLRSTVRGF